MGSLQRLRVARFMVCCVLLVAAVAGCARTEDTPIQQIGRLLAADEVDEALTKARRTAFDDPSLARDIAAALVNWADGKGNWEPAITAYLAAAEVAPNTPGAYIGLGKLQLAFADDRGLGNKDCRKALEYWRAGVAAAPELADDDRVRAAVAILAQGAGDYPLAADLAPNDGQAQLAAALWLLGPPQRGNALPYAQRARRLIGDRADTLMILAECGELAPADAEVITDVQTTVRAGSVFAINAHYAYMLIPAANAPKIVRVSLADGAVVDVVAASGGRAGLSPDGAWLAYSTPAEWSEPCEIRALNLTSNEMRVLAEARADASSIEWSPDGTHVAVASYEGLFVVGLDGTGLRFLVRRTGELEETQVPIEPRWSPDGQRIAYTMGLWEGSGAISVVDVESGEATVATAAEAHGARWLDNRRIAFGIASYGDFNGVVWVKDHASAPESGRALTAGSVDAGLVGASPDGNHVLVRMGLRYPNGPPSSYSWWSCEVPDATLTRLPIPETVSGIFWAADETIYYCADNRLVGFRLKP